MLIVSADLSVRASDNQGQVNYFGACAVCTMDLVVQSMWNGWQQVSARKCLVSDG